MTTRFLTRKVVAGLVGLCALLAIGASIMASMASSRAAQIASEANAASTATAVQVATASALAQASTAAAARVATDTAVVVAAQGASTATAVAQVTATAIALAQTAPAALATEQAVTADMHQVFQDNFADNHNAWFTGHFNDNETNSITDGVFQVVHKAQGASFELYQTRSFANFIADVDCRVAEGASSSSCGLVFGSDDAGGRWEFEVFNNYYRLSIKQGDAWTLVTEGNPAGALQPKSWNTLRVARRAGLIRLYVNDRLLASVADDRLSSGALGVATGAYQQDGTAEVQLDNFTIWEVP